MQVTLEGGDGGGGTTPEDPSGSRSPTALSHLQLLCGSSAWRQLSVRSGGLLPIQISAFFCQLISSSIKMRGSWRTEVSGLWSPGATHSLRGLRGACIPQRWRHSLGSASSRMATGCPKSAAKWASVQSHQLRARALPVPRARAARALPPEGAGWGRSIGVVVPLRPRPRGGRGPRGRRARLPSPSPPSSPASLYPTSGFPRWLGSVATAQEPFWTRFSSPPPPPRSWPLRTRPLRPGPGPSPVAPCPRRARPGPRPAAAPRPQRRPIARAALRASRSGPEPLSPHAAWEPKRRSERAWKRDPEKEREAERSRRRALRAPGAQRGPARGLRVSAGRRRGT